MQSRSSRARDEFLEMNSHKKLPQKWPQTNIFVQLPKPKYQRSKYVENIDAVQVFEFTVLGLHLSLIFSIFSKNLLLAKISWLCPLHVQSECWTLPGIWFGVWFGVWWSEQYESQHIKGCGSLPPLLGWGTVLAPSEGVRGGSEVVVALAAMWALYRTAFTLTWSWALVSDWTNDWQMTASKMSFC